MQPTIYFIEHIGTGSLSIMAKPASGDGINREFAAIASKGINTIVSLLESKESFDVGLHDEEALAIKHGMAFHSFPIKDLGVPASKDPFKYFIKKIHKAVESGENIVIHCHGGIGRSGLVAGGVLLHSSYTVLDAFAHITKKRGKTVPETDEQISWLIENQHYMLVASNP